MEKFSKICIYTFILIVIFFAGYFAGDKHSKTNIEFIDTTYNHIKLDSIQYNIIKKDSIIYKLKTEMKYETDKVYELDDSATIKLFIQLCESE